MRKGFHYILIALFMLLFITGCTQQAVNESVESAGSEIIPDYDLGFPGEVLDDTDTYIESTKEMTGADEKQEPQASVESTDGERSVADSKKESASEESGTVETVSEEEESTGPIKDNTYDGDLLKPPVVGSDGVL